MCQLPTLTRVFVFVPGEGRLLVEGLVAFVTLEHAPDLFVRGTQVQAGAKPIIGAKCITGAKSITGAKPIVRSISVAEAESLVGAKSFVGLVELVGTKTLAGVIFLGVLVILEERNDQLYSTYSIDITTG